MATIQQVPIMNDDSDKTMMRDDGRARHPGSGNDKQGAHVLPKGTRLGEFEVMDLIGEGGFGAVYLAYDHSLDRHVALKEYMPTGLATRTMNLCVAVRTQAKAGTFNAGLKSFINEAKMLAQFDSPSLVKVHRFWEAHGTAYMVMPYYEGATLKQALKEHRIKPSEPWIRLLLGDLFDAIETIHNAKCFHRDIAPDNILLLKDGRPLLLDFGAARRVIGDLTQCLTVILKPGYAPIEQYADISGLRQGPWTDIYALAAVVYYLISGAAPPPSVARVMHDELVPAREAGKDRYSPGFLEIIDNALAVKPEQRYQSIAQFRRALDALPETPNLHAHTRTEAFVRKEPTLRPADEEKTLKAPTVRAFRKDDDERPTAPAKPPAHSDIPAWKKAAPAARPARRWHIGWNGKWMLLGLMLGAGIGAGIYLGTYLAEAMAPPSPAFTASEPTSVAQSSGDSGDDVPETQAQTSPPAPKASSAAPAPPPANPAPREEALWNAAASSGTATDMERYLAAFPTGRYADTAKRKAEEIRRKQESATQSASAAATMARETRRKTADPQAAAAPPSAKKPAISADEELWNIVTAINEGPAYESYLSQFPNGRFAALAKDKLASLKPMPKQNEAPPPAVSEPQADVKMRTPPVAVAHPQQEESEPEKPAAQPAQSGKRLELLNQTMIGDFSPDPVTGIVSGTGKIVWKDGNQFEGTLVRGVKEGSGTFVWRNGQRYSGDWAHDTPNGTGTITYPNGNSYKGEVKDGLPHGMGTIWYADGDMYKGAWERGKNHGQGRYTWKNGSFWEGQFKDNKRTENGAMVFSERALRAARSNEGGKAVSH
jgi:serine/threonine protein kinase